MPAAIERRSPESGSQNRLDPQIPQNPRRAVADDRYQRSPSDSVRARCFGCVAVNAAKWPLVRRHCVQWQSTTARSGPRTSYRTAPQRQPPVPLIGDESSSRIIFYGRSTRTPDPAVWSPSSAFSGQTGLLLSVRITHCTRNLYKESSAGTPRPDDVPTAHSAALILTWATVHPPRTILPMVVSQRPSRGPPSAGRVLLRTPEHSSVSRSEPGPSAS